MINIKQKCLSIAMIIPIALSIQSSYSMEESLKNNFKERVLL